MKDKKILVIEDDPDMANLLILKLKKAGYKTILAEYANQGLEFAYNEKPDLIILDLILPGGDGASILSGLKRSPHTNLVPVIILTAVTDIEYKNRILHTGVNEYLYKPCNCEMVLKKIEEILAVNEQETCIGKILVIDDDRDFGKLIAKRLMDNNFKVIRVEDGFQGVRFAKKENPDLILLDIMLPGGDGLFVLKKLKKFIETRDIPVIILTAVKDPAYKIKTLEAGAEDYLEKPLDMQGLLHSIQQFL